MTSLKNQVSKNCPRKTPFEALLRGFWTMLRAQNDPYWVSRGVTDHWFSSFSRRHMPRVVHIACPTLGKGTFYTLLHRFCSGFDPNHGNVGMRTSCFPWKLMSARTWMGHTACFIFHTRSCFSSTSKDTTPCDTGNKVQTKINPCQFHQRMRQVN